MIAGTGHSIAVDPRYLPDIINLFSHIQRISDPADRVGYPEPDIVSVLPPRFETVGGEIPVNWYNWP